jgi:integrase
MASKHTDDKGRTRIAFRAIDKRQVFLRLGRLTERQAERAERTRAMIADLERAAKSGFRDETALRWADSQPARIHDALAESGLVPKREARQVYTLGSLLDAYFATIQVKPTTRTRYEQGQDRLLAYFDRDRELQTITTQDAEEWRAWLRAQTKTAAGGGAVVKRRRYSDATVAKDVTLARQFLTKAVRWGQLSANPFDGVKAGSQRNPDRLHYVPPEDAQRLLDACPDADWRCIIALCRWGGLRCPSEVLRLRWSDIQWTDAERAGRMVVRSPKTEHHEGKAERTVPLFPELEPILLDALDQAAEGAEQVVERYPKDTKNLRPAMLPIVRRAGLTAWPRLFQNLRASRVDEIRRAYPGKVADAWMGNSEGVSRAHYEGVRESDFLDAVATPVATQADEPACTGSQHPASEDSGVGDAGQCNRVPKVSMGATGLEPVG